MTKTQPIFRQEVLQQRHDREFGKALYQPGTWTSSVVWVAVLVVAAVVSLLIVTRYKESESVRGLLVARGGSHRVVAPAAATVQQVLVRPGDKVSRGQVLASLRVATFNLNGNNNQQETLRQLHIQQELLQQDQQVQEQLFIQQKAQLLHAIEESRVAGESLVTESNLLRQQLQLNDENRRALEILAQGHAVTKRQLQQAQVEHLNFLLRAQEADRRQEANRVHIESQQAQLANLKLSHKQTRLRMAQERQQLQFAIAQANNKADFSVVAQADGIVSAIAVSPDEPVNSQQPLFYITSQPDFLKASVYVPSRVLGQMYPGQELLLNYDAFDYQYFGRYRATVSEIDRASLDPREHLLPLPGIQEPVFHVTAEIDQAYVEGPDVFRLQAGMLFSADVVTANMSLLEFIFRPLLRMRARLS